MPRNKGTSRKGKPKGHDRAAGMGKALQKAQGHRYRPRSDGKNRRGDGGMSMQTGVTSIGLEDKTDQKTMSVLELNDLDDFLHQADMANREFVSEREGLVVLDDTMQTYKPSSVKWADEKQSDFVFTELSVPRRPAWDENTTAQELQQNEQQSFLEWRRAIALKEEEIARNATSAAVTPFEKNIEVWRQLWRVLERSSCLLQLVDARNPLFYLSDDLREYAKSLGKPMMVLLNKSDYLSKAQRQEWSDYLKERGWEPVFFSAVKEQQKLDAAAQRRRREEEQIDPRLNDTDTENEQVEENSEEDKKEEEEPDHEGEESQDGQGIDIPLTRAQLCDTMLAFARKHNCEPDERHGNRIQFGLVGFPNVGKSSVINVLVGSSKHTHGIVRVGVAAQPGKTKHFQTLFLPDDTDHHEEMMLCDCPGLVFPSFVSNTADLIAAGVFPIAQMRDHWPVTRLICQRIPREIINAHYGIQLPVPTELQMREAGHTSIPPPTGEEFLGTFCIARGMLAASSGIPDYTRGARMVIKDYAVGKLLYCHAPPSVQGDRLQAFYQETIGTALLNTKKLREKLLEKQKQQQEQQKETCTSDDERDDDEVDVDLLELLGETPEATNVQQQGQSKRVKKWGKKGRKGRNKDPYGCHSNPDDEMMSDAAGQSSGLVVKAGKYGRKGYTRPTAYGGARAAMP